MTRVVALEEHFALPDLVGRIPPALIEAWGWPREMPLHMRHDARLEDLGAGRVAEMDETGLAVQVLSHVGPGADLLAGDHAVGFARDCNDRLAAAVRARPDRLAGFAHLPTSVPHASAEELERCVVEHGFLGATVNGLTGGRFLDHQDYEPLLACAERLDVPVYLHPGLPPEPVRRAYFDGLPGQLGYLLSTAGWGWHAETALHVLRLALSGTLDRHRRLKLIVGHMGEGLPAMMARIDRVFTPAIAGQLDRTIGQTLRDQLWITVSGVFDLPAFMAALLTFGAERILFSVDYPFAPNAAARRFLDGLPVSPADRDRIAHGNADSLLRLAAS